MLRQQAEKERRMVLEVERRKKKPVVLEAKPKLEEEMKSLPMVVSLFRKGKMFFPEMDRE
jgi:hypothetical protein